MNVLFHTKNGLAADLTRFLKKEGHSVMLYVADKKSRRIFDGFINKTENWHEGLAWVGKDGLIIFDDRGDGAQQDALRKKGYRVVGGGVRADTLELERKTAQDIFEKYGLKVSMLRDFKNATSALEFAKRNRRPWVIKQSNGVTKTAHYIGKSEDGRDVIEVLKGYIANPEFSNEPTTLHERLDGVEIGVGRYFNGVDWVGPIEFNIEHSRLFAGDTGPVTNEMGTLAWYGDDDGNPLYQKTLAKMKPYLVEIGFKGDMELNCMVNEKGAYILEATPRFGTPIIHLQIDLHRSPWGDFLAALADGTPYNLKWCRGYGLVVLLALPPFPLSPENGESVALGTEFSLANLGEHELSHIHFEEVSRIGESGRFRIADRYGYALYVTGIGETVEEAQEKVYGIISKIVLPNSFYRNDIGVSFMQNSRQKLVDWGYFKKL